MLDTLDLKLKISNKEFSKILQERMQRLGELQRHMSNAKIPVIILFEGWHASGKGVIINSLVQAMDPRGFKVFTAYYPNEVEREKPFFWQFWNKLPAKGKISIFDRSWYGQTVNRLLEQKAAKGSSDSSFNEINNFERLLVDDNQLIIKFFTHISQKEHEKRIKKLAKELDLDKNMRRTEEDWREIGNYTRAFELYEEMFSKTDTAVAPWIAVEAEDENFSRIKVLDYIINVFTKKLSEIPASDKPQVQETKQKDNTFFSSVLKKVDLSKSASKESYKEKIIEYQKQLRSLQYKFFRKKIPMILLFEGWDAAGKGGTIRRVTANLDPRGYYVVPVAAPDNLDKRYHYLWRFWKEMASKGETAIFDRSWYGRVMVERIEGFATEDQWRRSYREINEMEEQLVNSGAVLLKFWLHIDKQEQLQRFKDRESNPLKSWKITEEDWRNRHKWDNYEIAVNEMLFRTSTTKAPWTIVESNDKLYGRLKVVKTVIDAMKEKIKE